MEPNTITIGQVTFTIPDHFQQIKWVDVTNGQKVFMIGKEHGQPRAYGPFLVEDKEKRTLKNIKSGKAFMEYPESLLIVK